MKQSEASKLFAILQAAFPRQPMPEQTLAIYCKALADLDSKATGEAIERIIATSKFFPTVAEVREAVTEAATANLLGPELAWEEVRRAIQSVGSYRNPEFSHPLINRAVDVIGWRTLCHSENIGVERAHFLRVYESIVEREKRDAQLGQLRIESVNNKPISSGTQKLITNICEAKTWTDPKAS